MRRIVFVACAVFGAALLASLGTLSAQAQSQDQYDAESPPAASLNAVPEAAPQEEPPSDEEPVPAAPSIPVEPPPPPENVDEPKAADLNDRVANSVADDPYTQIVDDATRGRFSARGWKRQKVKGGFRGGVSKAERGRASNARFKVKVPETGYYTLYARWPSKASNTAAARVGVDTPGGVRWEEVDQTSGSPTWMRVGAFEMSRGDRYSVLLDPGKGGATVADAVMISKNVLVGKNAQMVSVGGPQALSGGEAAPGGAQATGQATGQPTVSGKGVMGGAIVDTARRHLGRPYDYAHAPCQRAMPREDCSCLTRNVFLAQGLPLADSPVYQWNTDRGLQFRGKSLMQPGDLVFHDLTKDGDLGDHYADHVSIYSGNGNIIHASSYFGEVVESKERYLKNFWGAKRLGSR